jgi:hypothetical protein
MDGWRGARGTALSRDSGRHYGRRGSQASTWTSGQKVDPLRRWYRRGSSAIYQGSGSSGPMSRTMSNRAGSPCFTSNVTSRKRHQKFGQSMSCAYRLHDKHDLDLLPVKPPVRLHLRLAKQRYLKERGDLVEARNITGAWRWWQDDINHDDTELADDGAVFSPTETTACGVKGGSFSPDSGRPCGRKRCHPLSAN